MQQLKPRIRILNTKLYQMKFDEAYGLYLSEKYQAALIILQELKEMGFNNKELYIQIIQILIHLKQYEKAQEYYFQLIEKYPGCEEENETQKLKDQIKNLMKLNKSEQIKLEPISIEKDQFLLILLSIQNNDIGEKLLKQIQQVDNNQLIKIATAYFLSGRYKMSFDLCHKIPQDNTLTSANTLIYMNLYMMNKYEQAINHVKSLESQADNKRLYQNWIGDCYFQQKQYRQALQCYISTNPVYCTTMLSIGLLRFYLGEEIDRLLVDEEKQYYFIVPAHIDYDIKNSFFMNLICQINPKKLNESKLYETINHEIQILNEKQSLMMVYYHLFCVLKLKNDGLALQQQIFQILKQYSPKMAETYEVFYYLQEIEQKQIMMDELIEKVRNCYESGSKYKLLAKLFGKSGKINQVLENLVIALKLNPYDNEIYESLLKTYEEQDDFENRDKIFLQQVRLNRYNNYWIGQQIIYLLNQMKFGEILEILELLPIEEPHTIFLKLFMMFLLNNKNAQSILEQANLCLAQQKDILQVCYHITKKDIKNIENTFKNIKFELSKFINNGYYRIRLMITLIQPTGIQNWDLINRYYVTIFFLLSSLIFTEKTQQLKIIMNKQFRQKIPDLKHLLPKIMEIVKQIFGFDQQLEIITIFQDRMRQNIVSDFNQFLINFNNFLVNQTDQEWNNIFHDYELNNEINQNIFLKNPLVQEIYQISYFKDQLAQQAFEYSLKVIGYIIQFQTIFSQVETISQFFTQMFISRLPQKYYIDIITIMHL